MTGARPRLYLAGPDVFFPDAAARGAALKALCRRHGAEGLFPIDTELGGGGAGGGEADGGGASGGEAAGSGNVAERIRSANLRMIRDCDAVVANMMPFRGPAMDGGTAYEMGFGAALGRIVVGYQGREVPPFHRRVAAAFGAAPDADGGIIRDRAGFLVESFADGNGEALPLIDNLMMACGLDGVAADAAEAIGLAIALWRRRNPDVF